MLLVSGTAAIDFSSRPGKTSAAHIHGSVIPFISRGSAPGQRDSTAVARDSISSSCRAPARALYTWPECYGPVDTYLLGEDDFRRLGASARDVFAGGCLFEVAETGKSLPRERRMVL